MSYVKNTQGWTGLVPTLKPSNNLYSQKNLYSQQFNLVHDQVVEVKEVVVHIFDLADVDDPELYAAQPIWEWQQSESGRWVMEHAVEEPIWHRMLEPSTYSYKYKITARLKAKDYTFWALKWGGSR